MCRLFGLTSGTVPTRVTFWLLDAPDSLEVQSRRNADGSDPRQLTSLGGLNGLAAWSLDGKRIAFQHTSPNEVNGSLYLMDRAGGNITPVLKSGGPTEGGRPAWRPKKVSGRW